MSITKEEFYDKIDKIREIVDGLGDSNNYLNVDEVLLLLNELRSDAEQVLQDEYDLGLNRGWNHIDEEEQF
jgi:hypothetical protein